MKKSSIMITILVLAGVIMGIVYFRSSNSVTLAQDNQSRKEVTATDTSRKLLSKSDLNRIYQEIRNKKLETLPETEKQKTIDDWITILKNDPNFIAYKADLKKLSAEYLNRDKTKDTRDEGRPSLKEDIVGYYRSKGIKDPERMAKANSSMIKNMLQVRLKYPEYIKLDRETRKLINRRASDRMDISELKKRKIR